MSCPLRLTVGIVAALFVAVPAPATAQWKVTPFAGATSGGSTGFFDPDDAASELHPLFGVAVAREGPSRFSLEGDVFLTPGFFGDGSLVTSSRVWGGSGTLLIDGPRLRGVQPYGAVGLAALHVRIDDLEAIFPADRWLPALTAGGGVTLPLRGRFALRADARYVRSRREDDSVSSAGFGFVYLDFWRVTAGVVIRR